MPPTRTVVAGVDTHADTNHAAVIDHRGRLLDSAEFPATGAGYRQMPSGCVGWAGSAASAWKAPDPMVRA